MDALILFLLLESIDVNAAEVGALSAPSHLATLLPEANNAAVALPNFLKK